MAVENIMMQLRSHTQGKSPSTPPVLGQLHAKLVSQCSSSLGMNFQEIIPKRSLKIYDNIYS